MIESQNKAVQSVTLIAIEKFKLNYVQGVTEIKTVASDEFRNYVVGEVSSLISSGKVKLRATPSNAKKMTNPSKLKAYVSSLVSNTWNKDMRFNGKGKIK
jgi:hypothetical protein